MEELKEEKWLGDYLTEDLKRSVMLTIRKREAKTRRAWNPGSGVRRSC